MAYLLSSRFFMVSTTVSNYRLIAHLQSNGLPFTGRTQLPCVFHFTRSWKSYPGNFLHAVGLTLYRGLSFTNPGNLTCIRTTQVTLPDEPVPMLRSFFTMPQHRTSKAKETGVPIVTPGVRIIKERGQVGSGKKRRKSPGSTSYTFHTCAEKTELLLWCNPVFL